VNVRLKDIVKSREIQKPMAGKPQNTSKYLFLLKFIIFEIECYPKN
jgi:hypothetical protein